jgi:hypothetical protein
MGRVIPAKAGIHSASHWKYAADGLDSRLRGNDWYSERDPIPNDTTTKRRLALLYLRRNASGAELLYIPLPR